MFCPECGAEFRAGFVRCNNCDVDLVTSLPEEPEPPQPLPVFEATNEPQLAVVKSILEAAEIPFMVQGEELLTLGPYQAMFHKPGRSATVLVPGERAEEARELLQQGWVGEMTTND